MDPRARYEMKGILKNLREMGKTIIVSSHILSELGEICTRIGIIKNGSIVCEGTVDEIMTNGIRYCPYNIYCIMEGRRGQLNFKRDTRCKGNVCR